MIYMIVSHMSLQTVPMALFDSSGLIRETKKALYDIFDTVPEQPIDNIENFYLIFD